MNDYDLKYRRGKRYPTPALVAWSWAKSMTMTAALLGVAGCDNATTSASSKDPRPGANAQSVSVGSDTSSSASGSEVALNEKDDKTQPIRDTTFDDIKFDMRKTEPFRREMIPPEIEKLGGRRIRIRGYILPSYVSTGIDQFVLVRDNQECCFGPGAALYDCVLVKMQAGKTTDYTDLPVAVEGTFRIEQLKLGPEGKTMAVYQMVGESVE